MRNWAFIFLAGLVSCSPCSFDELRCDGEAETKKFTDELRKIQTKDDLSRSLPKIKKRFNKIAGILIELAEYQKKDPEPISRAGDELFIEMARIYEIPGGREAIESCQSEAVHSLDRAARRSR
jgi:hypothetical protein